MNIKRKLKPFAIITFFYFGFMFLDLFLRTETAIICIISIVYLSLKDNNEKLEKFTISMADCLNNGILKYNEHLRIGHKKGGK